MFRGILPQQNDDVTFYPRRIIWSDFSRMKSLRNEEPKSNKRKRDIESMYYVIQSWGCSNMPAMEGSAREIELMVWFRKKFAIH